MEKLLNTVEAAEYIGVKRGTLEIWRLKKTGPDYVKLSGRCVRYHPGECLVIGSRYCDCTNRGFMVNGVILGLFAVVSA